MNEPIKFYYVNARLEGKTALLAGPVMTVGEAENLIDICYEVFHLEEPMAPFASYGVMSVNAFAGYGIYNKALRANGFLNVPVPEN